MTHNPSSNRRALTHFDLRFGSRAVVDAGSPHPAARLVEGIVAAGGADYLGVPVVGTPYSLYASRKFESEGRAHFFVKAVADMEEGRIPRGALLYEGSVACELATSPCAWRSTLERYLNAVVAGSPLSTFCAPGPMPTRELPWLAGFPSSEALNLPIALKKDLVQFTRTVGLELLSRCREGVHIARQDGFDFTPDPGTFPELVDSGD